MKKYIHWVKILGFFLCFIALPSKAEAPENDLLKSPYFVVKAITKVADASTQIIDKSKQAMQAVGKKTELAEKATIHRMREILQALSPEELADPKNIALPLQKTDVNVNISGVIADVTITQVYKNTGKIPVEGTYVFPGSSRSAIYGMTMSIGDRIYEAKIKEKEEAQKIYDKAKKEGKKTALLEKNTTEVRPDSVDNQRENTGINLYPKTQHFKMSLTNILPNDEVKIEVKYTELLVPTNNKYQFYYPSPILAKYENQLTPEGGERPDNDQFEITVKLQAGMKIQGFACNKSATLETQESNFLEVNLNSETSKKQNFVLNYELAGEKIETGVLLYEGEEENFFLAMVQPPKRPDFNAIPAREYIFVIDISGSMSGFPLNTAKKLMQNLLQNVRPKDRFNVLLFAGASDVFRKESIPATEKNLDKALNFIDHAISGGGTELHSALERLLEMPALENYSRNVVIVTDGGIHFPPETYTLMQENANKFNFFPLGIGSGYGVSKEVIRGIALASNTIPFLITSEQDANKKARVFKKLIQTPVLTDLKVNFSGIEAYDIEPVAFSDIFENKPVLIFGKWRGEPTGNLTITGVSDKPITLNSTISKDLISDKNSALKYLWARTKIEHLNNLNQLHFSFDIKQQIIDLGLKYNLLTDYTSFVVIEEDETMQNVANSNSGAVPEPHEWLLIGLLVGLVLFLTLKNYIS